MSLFLSRLHLNPRSREAQRDLADCHCLHRRVMAAFPDCGGSARVDLCVLHRLEADGDDAVLLVQSRVEPTWKGLPVGYLGTDWFQGEAVATRSLEPLLAYLKDGIVLRFRLRANPTRRIDTKSGPNGERRNGKRVPLRDDGARLAWLERQASLAGFELLTSTPGVRQVAQSAFGRVSGWRPDPHVPGSRRRVTLEGVLFEGRLRVTDPDRLRGALAAGIGPGKAYGFGLLSLARG